MTATELAALKAEAQRLWDISEVEEQRYKAHLHAWCEANDRVREAELEMEIQRRLQDRLAAERRGAQREQDAQEAMQ